MSRSCHKIIIPMLIKIVMANPINAPVMKPENAASIDTKKAPNKLIKIKTDLHSLFFSTFLSPYFQKYLKVDLLIIAERVHDVPVKLRHALHYYALQACKSLS